MTELDNTIEWQGVIHGTYLDMAQQSSCHWLGLTQQMKNQVFYEIFISDMHIDSVLTNVKNFNSKIELHNL